MPGQTIGTALPTPKETVLQARIIIRKQGGKYSHEWQFEPLGEERIITRVQEFLEKTVKELNGSPND